MVLSGGFCVNSRVLGAHTTGVQRHLMEVEARLPVRVPHLQPAKPLHGIRGHAWEQLHLPLLVGKRVLWSPSNTGPLAIRKQVVTIHDLAPLDHPDWFGWKFAAWYQYLIPRLAKRVERILVDSEFTKERLLAVAPVPQEKVQVVYCGVSDHFFHTDHLSASVQDQVNPILDIPGSRYVLSVGSLEPRKNLARLLQAWHRILPELDEDLWLVLSGAKGRSLVFQDIPELKHLPPRVYLAGYVDDDLLPALYAGAQLFVYPSVYEGFGLPPLEAMASGTPVIAGNQASLPEVVGDAGILVDPFNVDEIGEQLLALMQNPQLRVELSERGRARAKTFTWQNTADMTWNALMEVADS